MRKKNIGVGFSLLAFVLALSACGSSSNHAHEGNMGSLTSSPSATVSASNAESLYKSNCMSCHGATLQGKIGPSLNKVGGKLSQEQIAAKIQNGGGGMPSFKTLKEADIESLSEWLAAKKQ
ncbi:cytochrome c [Paenibacillus sp. N3.4]|uniref:c-type cytochrome n=1 Tax=Paenibacillus sp. N3.4 TaxID=2603222 RepID=UPI0011C942A3|nr:cytochrome c [Paenibacillus sp. N3.4]TXK85009.1 c-type cytochrome [Paenibacillus sp. N3.4]